MGITNAAISVSGGVAHTDVAPRVLTTAPRRVVLQRRNPVSELNRIVPSQCSDATASEPSREAAPTAERLRIVDKDATRC